MKIMRTRWRNLVNTVSQRTAGVWSALRCRWEQLLLWQRITAASLAGLILITTFIPLADNFLTSARYSIDKATTALIGTVNNNLSSKVTFDRQQARWRFNASYDQSDATLAAQTGGTGKDDRSLYATDFPTDPSRGITFTDTQTKLSFAMIPQFKAREGRQVNGHIVYPLSDGGKMIYSAKNNGMKEDIVLPKFISKELTYSYSLRLPNTLQAKIQANGSVGIFSADPILFGTISADAEMDAAKLKSAREQGEKNHLLFVIPAPTIVQSGQKKTRATARFGLNGTLLTLTARDMDTVSYPASVDPSVVVTSSSEFETGNNESNIAYNSGQINRGNITGGSINTGWTVSNAAGSFTARQGGASAVYNGYIYYIGGNNTNSTSTEVNVAAVSGSGVISDWVATTSLPDRFSNGAAGIYNGKLYVYGGYSSGTTLISSVYYAAINSDGTIGAWAVASNAMATPACRFGGAISNGYIYAAGGATGSITTACGTNSTTMTNTVQYAPLLANGDVGTWTTSPNTFTNARKDPGFTIYNGYAYLSAGTLDGSTNYRDTQIAKVKSDGSIGAWRTSTQQIPTSGKFRFGFAAYNGYLYISGGNSNLTGTLYAQIYANGDIGPWNTNTSLISTGRYGHGFAIYKGYMYYYAGYSSTFLRDAGSAKIDDPGVASTSTATTSLGTTPDSGLGGAGFVYNGYIYYTGGFNGTAYSSQTRYAPINSDGTIGTWALTTALQTPVTGGAGVGYQSYAVYNNRVYMIGGTTLVSGTATPVSSIQYASFNTNGTLSSWTINPTAYTAAVSNQAATAYNGFMYMTGDSGSTATNKVYRATINSDGTIGSWALNGGGAGNLSTTVASHSMLAYNRYLYVIGGNNGSYLATVQYAPINSDGTLGNWSTTSSLATARSLFGATSVGGYLYAVGGETGSGAYTNTVEYARFNADGSLGSWKYSANLAVTAGAFGVASWNDTIYTISGFNNGTRGKTVLYLKSRAGGGGTSGTWAVSSNTLPTGRFNHGSAVYNGYLYVIGGQDSATTRLSNIAYAALGDGGSIGTWNTTTPLPSARSNMGIIVYQGYLYSFGGKLNATDTTDSAISAPLQSDGTIGAWTTLGNLPDQLSAMGTVEHNGYAYLLGGLKATPNNSVQYVQLAANGGIGTWATTTAFTGARYGLGVTTNDNKLYAMGGIDGSGNYLKDVQYATMNTNGTLGSWTNTTELSTARAYFSPAVLNGYLYAFGGNDGSSALSRVDYAPLNASGTIGSWSAGTPLSTARYGLRADIANGNAFVTGGFGSSTYYNSALSAPLQTSPRTAVYSKLIDLGSLYAPGNITYGGSLPNGINAIGYRSAGSDNVFGATAPASSAGYTSGICSVSSVRYILLSVTIDDSLRASVADENSSSSYVTDLTLNYAQSASPVEKRLAHGKYFSDNSLQPLETCGR